MGEGEKEYSVDYGNGARDLGGRPVAEDGTAKETNERRVERSTKPMNGQAGKRERFEPDTRPKFQT